MLNLNFKAMIGNIIKGILEGGSEVLDKVLTTKEEKLQLFNELEALNQKDRDSARDLYKSDNLLQKIYALVFLVGYMVLIVAMLFFIYKLAGGSQGLDLPEWAVAFLSTLFGAMSAKVSTITDFLFGGSKSAEIQERRK